MARKRISHEWGSPSTITEAQSFLPFSFRRSTLGCTAIATLLLLGATVVLHILDARNGVILVGRSADGLSIGQFFEIRYLPTILTVIYGSWITTLDLDVKRLEPWSQLSLGSAVSAASSLLCRYDTEFVLSVLAKSMRSGYCIPWPIVTAAIFADHHRHWIVLTSTWLAILATIILPAVQNSMFSVQKAATRRGLQTSNPTPLADLHTQTKLMSNNFLLSAYSVTWLGQNSPAFSTNQYALAPFDIDRFQTNLSGNRGVVIAPTTRYWVELNCWSPSVITTDVTESLVSFDDGQGCMAANLLSYNATTTSMYDQSAAYESYLFSSSSLGWNPFLPNLKTTCPDKPHLLLATWRKAGSDMPNFAAGGNATAMFCQAEYYSEPVNATLRISDLSVVSYTTTGPQSELLETTFNRTQFEFIATSGAPPLADRMDNLTLVVDVADASYVAQKTRIQNMSVVAPDQQSNDVLIGFALGITKLPAEEYLNFETLSTAYNSAFQLLFAHAIRYTFDGTSGQEPNSSISGVQEADHFKVAEWILQDEIVRIVPGFAFVTEILLMVMCIICGFLLISVPKRPLYLCQNPDSLAGVMLLSRSESLQRLFSHWSSSSAHALESALQDESFQLDKDEDGPVLTRTEPESVAPIPKFRPLDSSTAVQNRSVRSLETSWTISGMVAFTLTGGICVLIGLSVLTQRKSGLELPSMSDVTRQLLLNFLPTAAATLLAMYLSLLCRLYSFLRPIHDLAKGNASARSTLLARYTSLPPQLLSVEAFQASHYLLGVMSVATLLSSVLTVTAASMFILQQTDTNVALQASILYEPNVIDNATSLAEAIVGQLPGSSTSDGVYATLANISDSVPLPSWTSESYGFMPNGLPAVLKGQAASSYQFQSLGYGAQLQCLDLQKPAGNFSGNIVFQNNGTTFQLWANFTSETNGRTECVFDSEYANSIDRLNLAKLSTSTAALEISNVMRRWNGSIPIPDEFCATRIVKGWVRASAVPEAVESDAFAMEYNATIILCQPQMMSQEFMLETTSAGDVLSAIPNGNTSYSLPATVNLSSTLTTALVITRDTYAVPQWHSDTVARDWSNDLYQARLGNRDFLNASLPPPSVEYASEIVSDMFSRLFAVQLFLDRDKLEAAGSVNADESQVHIASMQPVIAAVPTQKLFMSKINSAISVAILIFDLIVLLTFRLTLPKPFLPRMPFTIASQIAFFSGSHVINDVVKAGGDLRKLDEQGYRYAYGKYIGKDGWLHMGIERQQFVTKL